MALLTDKQLRAIQLMGEQSFKVSCVLRKKEAFDKDLTNPYGDSDITFESTTTTFRGWLVPTTTIDFTMGVSQIISAGNFVLRVPATLDPEPGDKITIQSNEYFVSESSTEQTWPEWIIVRLRRIQG